jgi:hypothetical protein
MGMTPIAHANSNPASEYDPPRIAVKISRASARIHPNGKAALPATTATRPQRQFFLSEPYQADCHHRNLPPEGPQAVPGLVGRDVVGIDCSVHRDWDPTPNKPEAAREAMHPLLASMRDWRLYSTP